MKKKGLDLALLRVKEFHQKFNHPAPSCCLPLNGQDKERRINWMIEEIEEFRKAETLEEQVDALIDLLYFTLGTFVEMGIQEIHDLFEIVHKSNMSKLWPDGRPRFREGDGKIVKPPGWKDPKIEIKRYLLKICRKKI